MKTNKFKTYRTTNCARYCFDNITKLEDFDFDNILIDETLHQVFFIYVASYKTLIVSKHCVLDLIK